MGLKNISSKNDLSLDNICYLIAVNDDESESETMCFCAELPVQSNEFYKAGQKGIKPSKTLIVDSENYADEEKVTYGDVRYCVYRTYPRDDGVTELYLEYKAGG